MFCNNCGNSLDENAYVCDKCGAMVSPGVNQMFSDGTETAPAQKKSKPPVGAIVGSSFLILFAVVSLLILFLLAGLQNMLSADSLRRMFVSDSELNDELQEIIDDFKREINDSLVTVDPDTGSEIADRIIFEDDEIEDLYFEIISDAATFCMTGEGDPFQSDRVIDFVKDHEDEIEDLTGERISKAEYDELEELIDELNEEMIREYEREIKSIDGFEYFQMFFSPKLLFVVSVITMVLFLAIFAIFNKNVHYSLDFVGGGLLLTGIFNLLTTAVFSAFVKSIDEPIVEEIMSIYYNRLFLFSGIALVLGIVMLVVGIVIGVKKKEAGSAVVSS